jgi:phosphatidylethanolamine-binding protein (PEBP) family uncharacterized protein
VAERKENHNHEDTSPAFESDGTIPSKYTCDGDDVSPPIK